MLEKLIGQTLDILFGRQKYCRLDAVAKLEMRDIKVMNDANALRFNTEPRYLIVTYQDDFIATVYPNHLSRAPVKFSWQKDQDYVEKVWKTLETYYS
ncbi:TPA: hypothetical protein HA242_01155 [Candidatus Woesearchaeota archaeon]|nr:hypothetical protein [Candidatus Woesearchaeota archaeon]